MHGRASIFSLVCALALGLAGCAKSIDPDDLEGELADQLSAGAGVNEEDVSVSCPDDIDAEEGKEFDCTLIAPNGDEVTVNVTLTNDDGGFEAEVPEQQFQEP